MHIDGTEFGSIVIDGKTYDHDVVIRLWGDVVKRKKKLSNVSTGPRTRCLRTRRGSCTRRAARN